MPEPVHALFAGGWRLDRASSTPAYAQIEERILDLIESGALRPGERVPSERALAERLSVSRLTARAALTGLARRGVVERRLGRQGTVVARPKLAYDLREFAGFTEMVQRHGLEAGARMQSALERAAPAAVAHALRLPSGAAVYRIQRLRLASGEPLALEDSWVPAQRFPGLLMHDLTASLYELMHEAYGRAPVRASERLEATVAADHDAATLGVQPGAPLMRVVRTAFAADGAPVEYARDHHRADRAQFLVEVEVAGAPPRMWLARGARAG